MCVYQKHVWDQLFTVDTIWNIGETGDMYLPFGGRGVEFGLQLCYGNFIVL